MFTFGKWMERKRRIYHLKRDQRRYIYGGLCKPSRSSGSLGTRQPCTNSLRALPRNNLVLRNDDRAERRGTQAGDNTKMSFFYIMVSPNLDA